MLNRRAVLCGALATVLATPLAVEAQPAGKVYRLGILTVDRGGGFDDALRAALRELGYVEGRNLVIETRYTEGRAERVDDLALQLVRLKVDVIVATHPAAVFGATRATATIPIIMVHTPDPVQLGLVATLARPGGNVTGLTSLSVDLSLKQLELLKEVVPRASRVAVLWNPDNPWHPVTVKGLEAVQSSLRVRLQILGVRRADDIDTAFRAMTTEAVQAVVVLTDPMTFAYRQRVADLALKHRLPAMAGLRAYAEAGGLMSYWADSDSLGHRVASYIDRILRGARPAEMPIEQPTKYELVINLKTARALGLTIPSSLLLRADRVIE
jgi:putative tryptophan/tyrosine transport system substrate-binding protein